VIFIFAYVRVFLCKFDPFGTNASWTTKLANIKSGT
jgi:hypothetical protein